LIFHLLSVAAIRIFDATMTPRGTRMDSAALAPAPWIPRTEKPVLTAPQIKDLLKLQPLPFEGGFFAEVYRSTCKLPSSALPPGYPDERSLSTAIYYLLTPDNFSAMHKLRGDEVYHFYLGDPVEMLLLKQDGSAEAILIGADIASGMHLQHAVAGGTWQGARLAPGGQFALMGTTMTPGFDPADFELGNRDELRAQYSRYSPLIAMLTR
jgi:hypothetical protein